MKVKFKSGFSLIELSVVILVIGLLVIGITQGSRITSQAKIRSARALTKSAPVNSINDLVLWVDSVSEESFSNSSTIQNNDTVTFWQDINPQTTLKNNLAGTATYVQNGINGLPAIQFNGTSQYFDSSQTVSSNLNITYFVVLKNDDVTTLRALMTSDGPNLNGSVHFSIQGGKFETISAPESSVLQSGSVSIGKVYVATLRITNDFTEFFINGVASTSRSSGVIVNNKNLKLNIGSWNKGPRERFFDGQIGEIIAFRRSVTNVERQGIEDYLKEKWAVN